MTRAKLRATMTMMADRNNIATDVAEQLGISVSTLYAYVDGEGQSKPRAEAARPLKASGAGILPDGRAGAALWPLCR